EVVVHDGFLVCRVSLLMTGSVEGCWGSLASGLLQEAWWMLGTSVCLGLGRCSTLVAAISVRVVVEGGF
ncbi:hypothetical protein Ancab_029492, partial [Ancistrocladus abbreviatus]